MLSVRDAILRSLSGRNNMWQPLQNFATGTDMLTSGDGEVRQALEQLLVGSAQV